MTELFEYFVSKNDPRLRPYTETATWTAFSDLGTEFDDGVLTRAEYERVEDLFVDAAAVFMRASGFSTFRIDDPVSPRGRWLGSAIRLLRVGARNGRLVGVSEALRLLRLSLRGEIWCALVAEDQLWVGPSFDYYMRVRSVRPCEWVIPEVERTGLFVGRSYPAEWLGREGFGEDGEPTTMRRRYAVRAGVRGADFGRLLEAAGTVASILGVICRSGCSCVDGVLAPLSGSLVRTEQVWSWPEGRVEGTVPACRHLFTLDPALIEKVQQIQGDPLAWRAPDLPTDLHLLRADGAPVLVSDVAAAAVWIDLNDDEHRVVEPMITDLLETAPPTDL